MASELQKIQQHESETLESLRKKIEAAEESSPFDSSKPPRSPSLLELTSISPKDLIPPSEAPEEEQRKSQSTQKVQQEIEKLRQTLGQRKVLKELPEEVDQA